MSWELYVKYANGTEQVLQTYRNLDKALDCVDKLYADGYPMHLSYGVRSGFVVKA